MPLNNSRSGWGLLAALIAGLAAAGLYGWTLAPGVLVGDSGEFQFTGAILGIPHPTGYPLYTLLNKLWSLLPVGDVAYRINLSSAVYMAGAVGLVTALAWRLLAGLQPETPASGRAGAALAAGGLLAVSGTVWAQALVARAYALNALLVAGCLLALLLWVEGGRRGAFWAALLLLGLALAHHGTTVTLLPGYLLLGLVGEWRARARESGRARWARWAGGLLALALGLSPYLLFVYRFVFGYTYYWGNPRTWGDVFFLARGGPFAGQILAYPLTWDSQLARAGFGGDQLARQFGGVGVLLGLAGLARLLLDRRTRPVGAGLAVLGLGNFAFAVNYGIIGHIYLIPTYLFWVLGMAVAGAWPLTLVRHLRRPLLRGSVAAALVLALGGGALGVPAFLAAARWAQQDRSGDTRVRDLALETLAAAAPGARVYVDWESVCVFRYYQYVEHRRLDLDLYSEDPRDWAPAIAQDLAAGRAAYVGGFAGPNPPAPVQQAYRLQRVGLVYQVLGRVPASR